MSQTQYIDIDEEIISAVGRLRNVAEPEVIFVFPKRALILQSIVSLRLLQREAQKLGKKIIILSQDTEGRLLAEKAGFVTEDYRDSTRVERFVQEKNLSSTKANRDLQSVPNENPEESLPILPLSTTIGSSDFYGQSQNTVNPISSTIPSSQPDLPNQKLRIRDANPRIQTSLNSLNSRETSGQRPLAERSSRLQPYSTASQTTAPQSHKIFASNATELKRQEKLYRFLSGVTETNDSASALVSRPASQTAPIKNKQGIPWTFLILGLLSIIALFGTVVFFFLPRAEVFIVPKGVRQSVKYQFVGMENLAQEKSTSQIIPARLIEKELTIAFVFETTGTPSNTNQKARGTVVIYNNYSPAAQPLVATTRLMTADGKIFRLVEGVTVPGTRMKNGQIEPGVIEAKVVADAPGSEYNIGPSEFTIPGFQGSPKYSKFIAKSNKPMVGGGSGVSDNATLRTVTQSDIDATLAKANEEVRALYIRETLESLSSGEKLLEESIEITPVGQPTLPLVGTSADSFDFQGRFRVRSFVISEDILRNFIEKQVAETAADAALNLAPLYTSLTYGPVLSNYAEKKIDLSVQADVTLQAALDKDLLRRLLAGQDESGIRNVLSEHPEIKRLRVQFKPQLFISVLPKNPNRITITLVEDDAPR